MPLSTDTYPEPINNYTESFDDDSSDSDDDSGSFRVWGSGSGSSASLSKFLGKKEKDPERDLKKQIAKRDLEVKRDTSLKEVSESNIQKSTDLMKEAITNNSNAVVAPSSAIKPTSIENIRTEVRPAPSVGPSVPTQLPPSDTNRSRENIGPLSNNLSARGSVASLAQNASRHDLHQATFEASSEESFRGAPNIPHVDSATLYASYYQGSANSHPLQHLQREFMDAEPEIPDVVPASKILRRIGAYRNWSEHEIQSDLAALEVNRIRTVRDIREMTTDGWREVKELVPLVKDLLIKEVCKRSLPAPRGVSDIPVSVAPPQRQTGPFELSRAQFAPSSNVYAPSEAPNSNYDLRNPRAPVSTPMDTPDFSANRRNFQPRNIAW